MLMALIPAMAAGFLFLSNGWVNDHIETSRRSAVSVFSMVLHHHRALQWARDAGLPVGVLAVPQSPPFHATQEWKSQIIDDQGRHLLVTHASDFNPKEGAPWPLKRVPSYIQKLDGQSSNESMVTVAGRYTSHNNNKNWIGEVEVPFLGDGVSHHAPAIATWMTR